MPQQSSIDYGVRGWNRGRLELTQDCACLVERPSVQSRRAGTALNPGRKVVVKSLEKTSATRALPSSPVQARDLRTAFFLVLALYASLGIMNLTTEWPVLLGAWPRFIEFLANGVLAP
jgi:hypothetical protein